MAPNRLSSEGIIFGVCNSRAWSATRAQVLCTAGRRHPDANVFRRLEARHYETGSATRNV